MSTAEIQTADMRNRFGLPPRCNACGSTRSRFRLLCDDCGDILSILPVANATHVTTQAGTA